MYADDTSISDSALSLADLNKTLNSELNDLEGLFPFVDLSFGSSFNPMPNRHLPLPPLREESETNYDDHSYYVVSIFIFVNVLATAPLKSSSHGLIGLSSLNK